jgi:hypothetical protein
MDNRSHSTEWNRWKLTTEIDYSYYERIIETESMTYSFNNVTLIRVSLWENSRRIDGGFNCIEPLCHYNDW